MKKSCAKYIKVCKEIHISFLPLEAQVNIIMKVPGLMLIDHLSSTSHLKSSFVFVSPVQVFTCENQEAFKNIYSPHCQDRDQTLEQLANQIVTLCATLDEYPGVRYKRYCEPCALSVYTCWNYTWCMNGDLMYLHEVVIICRDSALDYGKKLAELVDNKLARHCEMDEKWKKKVRYKINSMKKLSFTHQHVLKSTSFPYHTKVESCRIIT